jgi:glycosyltransferase involved in cell wall biosynthesis
MNWGGQEYRTLLEHNYLNRNGHKSWLVCHPNSAIFEKAKEFGSNNVLAMEISKAWNINTAIKIVRLCIKEKITIINSHSPKDSLICLLAFLYGIPLLRSRQISSPIKKSNSYQHLCSHVIAAADAIKKNLIDIGVEEEKITVIGEGVDFKEFNPNLDSVYLKREFGIQKGESVIVNIGMIRTDKGQEYYLESAKLILETHKNVKFFLIGEGTHDKNLEKKLKELITEYGISKNFFMPGYRSDVAAFIHLADFTVISSIAVEAQSRIVPQSFATKRTVISTNTGGLTELVHHQVNGLVVPPQDVKAMVNAIKILLDNQELKDNLAENAYKLAINQLSFEQMMEKTLLLYARFFKKD